jgi:hypothetical protein
MMRFHTILRLHDEVSYYPKITRWGFILFPDYTMRFHIILRLHDEVSYYSKVTRWGFILSSDYTMRFYTILRLHDEVLYYPQITRWGFILSSDYTIRFHTIIRLHDKVSKRFPPLTLNHKLHTSYIISLHSTESTNKMQQLLKFITCLFLLLHRACCYNCCFIPTHVHMYTLKHQFMLIFKILKSMLKHFSEVAPTCFGPCVWPFSGGSRSALCALTKLDFVDLRSLFVCAVCGRMSQTNSERTSTESNLVTAQSADREPPEDGHTHGPKHVGATSLKRF